MKNIEDIAMVSIGTIIYVSEELVYEAENIAWDIICNLNKMEKVFNTLLFEAESFIEYCKEDTVFVGQDQVEFYEDKSARINSIVKSISYKQTALARLASEIEKAKEKIENMRIIHEK